jgi:hypothetical protein
MRDFEQEIKACDRLAEVERILYEHSDGRLSRSTAKALVSKMVQINKLEAADSAKYLLELAQVKQQFYRTLAG